MVRLTKIYTRTGDGGTTRLVGGMEVSKAASRVAAYGDVDETNSAIGLAACAVEDVQLGAALKKIQNDLFDLGADLANPGPDKDEGMPALRIKKGQEQWLEAEIDRMNEVLAPLTSFVLPGGETLSARLHLARAICRRAERVSVMLAQEEAVNPHALVYLNRLSDFLFVAARFANHGAAGDVLWVPGGER